MTSRSGPPRVVRVLPEGTIDKTFDYLVPDALGDQVRVGTLVRVELRGRRVRAWVVEDGVSPPDRVSLRPIAKVTGWGPAADLVDLAGWAAWRWAGRRSWFLGTASPAGAVRALPAGARMVHAGAAMTAGAAVMPNADRTVVAGTGRVPYAARLAQVALARRCSVVRLPPLTDPFPVVLEAAGSGPTLALAPSLGQADRLATRLRRRGLRVAVVSGGRDRDATAEWAAARAGADVVLGTRAAAWAPVHGLSAAVVLDEHDEVYQEEQTVTWHARDVVAERARRAGVPCVLVSPAPSLDALAWAGTGGIVTPDRRDERDGWPVIEVVDRRADDPGRTGLWSDRLVRLLRSDRRIVCVLNRSGRSRLLACSACGALARCERCESAVRQPVAGELACGLCGTTRPVVCQSCGATKLKNLRLGVSRAREELASLLHEPVDEVSAARPAGADPPAGANGQGGAPTARVVVGTEAALHQVPAADTVVFLDMDQELLAPRYRAVEQALALVVRASRVLARGASQRGAPVDRAGAGRVVVQTRLPDHEVIQAVLHADPSRVSDPEQVRRRLLRFPPAAAVAVVSGPAAPAFVEPLQAAGPLGVEVLGPSDGRWLVRAADHPTLCDALAATPRPATGRLRIEVDPARI